MGKGGLERPTESKQLRKMKHLPQNNSIFNCGVISKDQSFLYICVGDSIPFKDKAVPVNLNKLFHLCCALYLFR